MCHFMNGRSIGNAVGWIEEIVMCHKVCPQFHFFIALVTARNIEIRSNSIVDSHVSYFRRFPHLFIN